MRRVEVDPALGGLADLLQLPPGAVLDLLAEVRRDDAAAVGDRGVGDRELERRRLQVALTDGEVDVVAAAPRAVDAAALEQRLLRLVAELELLAAALVVGELAVAPLAVGHEPAVLARQIDPGGLAEPELACPVLEHRAWFVERRAELVEEHVRGDLQRARQRERPVDRVAGVLELAAAVLEHAGIVEHGARRDYPLVDRGERGDRLERRAGRIARRDRAVEQRRAVLGRVEPVERRLVDRLGEQVGVEARVRAERQHLAVARVERHESTCVRRVAVALRRLDRAGDRVLRGALQPEVEREPQLAALDRVGAGRAPRVVAVPGRVDDHAREAVGAAQVLVVALLDPVLADPGAGAHAAVLLGPDLFPARSRAACRTAGRRAS